MGTANRPQMPLFASAPRVEIYMGGSRIAYAIGINFNLSVDVQLVYAFGQYGPVSIEPTFYNLVTGTVQIIRLANGKNRSLTAANSKPMNTGLVESIKHVNPTPNSVDSSSANSVLSVSGLHNHLDPERVMVSSLFDLIVYLKVPTKDVTEKVKLNTPESLSDVNSLAKSDLSSSKPWIALRGCRLNARNVNITMGQIVNEPVSFTGLYADPYDNADSPAGMFNTDEQTKDA